MIVRDVYKIIYTSNVLYHFIEISEDIEAKNITLILYKDVRRATDKDLLLSKCSLEDGVKTSCCYLAIIYKSTSAIHRSVRNKKKAETQAEMKIGQDPEIFAQIAIGLLRATNRDE